VCVRVRACVCVCARVRACVCVCVMVGVCVCDRFSLCAGCQVHPGRASRVRRWKSQYWWWRPREKARRVQGSREHTCLLKVAGRQALRGVEWDDRRTFTNPTTSCARSRSPLFLQFPTTAGARLPPSGRRAWTPTAATPSSALLCQRGKATRDGLFLLPPAHRLFSSAKSLKEVEASHMVGLPTAPLNPCPRVHAGRLRPGCLHAARVPHSPRPVLFERGRDALPRVSLSTVCTSSRIHNVTSCVCVCGVPQDERV
jgi:hypothetical protein